MGTSDADAIRRMAGLATPMALRVAVTLELPDLLRDGASVDELAAGLAVDPVALDLLLDHRILSRCVEAAHPAGRILVIEPVGGRHAHSEVNLAMLAIFGGRERRVDEFRALAAPHDLHLATVTDVTDQRCLLEFRLG